MAALPRAPRQVQRQPARRARVNAFTGEVGKANGQALAALARELPARAACAGSIVGDANYGEGSSREHAALSPRLLGGAAVIARSFARIHESNLKKQGLLALTFRDPADYERVRAGDRISLLGLAALAPGRPVECRLDHADGIARDARARATRTARAQLDWFRAGSALNLIERVSMSAA